MIDFSIAYRQRMEKEYNENLKEYGLHPKCLECPRIKKCNVPQWNSPGLYFFWCAEVDKQSQALKILMNKNG